MTGRRDAAGSTIPEMDSQIDRHTGDEDGRTGERVVRDTVGKPDAEEAPGRLIVPIEIVHHSARLLRAGRGTAVPWPSSPLDPWAGLPFVHLAGSYWDPPSKNDPHHSEHPRRIAWTLGLANGHAKETVYPTDPCPLEDPGGTAFVWKVDAV